MRDLLRRATTDPLVLAAASPPDRHGYFSLGVNADYVASFIGRARFFLEANRQMPRTFGRNQIHISQVVGWIEVDRPLVEVAAGRRRRDRRAASPRFVAERIPDGATIQIGIGAIPNAILAALADHRDLGVHTELISDGVDRPRRGAASSTASRKQLNRTKTVGTFALGTRRLYDFLDENAGVRAVAGALRQRPTRHRQRAELRVDQLDDRRRPARPVRLRDDRRPLLLVERRPGRLRPRRDVLPRRPGLRRAALDHRDGTISKIVPELAAGDVVTTLKNTVDKVVTEWGVAELRGRSIRERADGADRHRPPAHRDQLAPSPDGSATSDAGRRAGRDRWPYRRSPATAHHREAEPADPDWPTARRRPSVSSCSPACGPSAGSPWCTRGTRSCSPSTSCCRGSHGAPVIAIRTRAGNVIDHTGELVGFEIDGVDPARDGGWSVLVRGRLSRVVGRRAVRPPPARGQRP